MKALQVSLSILLFYNVLADSSKKTDLSCPEIGDNILGSLVQFLSKPQKFKGAQFYLASKNGTEDVLIGNDDWSALNSSDFDPSLKTYFIIHGYMSNHKKKWILELKEKLFKTKQINLIIADWSKGSNQWNYVNTVRVTEQVAHHIVNFLENMKTEVRRIYHEKESWNRLYFIGHSLGAHISGQTGHLLRKHATFFKVERITGLDPAQPCFIHADMNYKLDKDDADFVDIIHTQTGNSDKVGGLGLQNAIGHIDFYVNGGAIQPDCDGSALTTEISRMICSHKMATRYFIESLDDSNSCKFKGYSWDQSYDGALEIISNIKNGNTCSECPEMGINASKYNKAGTFLVVTPVEKPRCELNEKEVTKVLKAVEELKEKKDLFKNFDVQTLFSQLG